MKVKYIIAVLIMVALMIPAAAYAAEHFAVEGYVFEKDLGEPLPNASIYWTEGSQCRFMIKTDQNGFYHIDIDDTFTVTGQHVAPFRVMALVAYGRPNPIFTSSIGVSYPPKDEYIYHRDIYIDVKGQYQGQDPK